MQFLKGLCIFLFALVLLSGTLNAQALGTIAGVTQDESGAVIAGVKVTITNVDTGIARAVVTDTAGRYEVTGLIPGQYEIQAAVTGFQTEIRRGLTLNVGSEINIPIALKVGQLQQVTEVTAEASVIETTNATIAGLVEGNTVRDLPLNGRSFDQLVALESSAPPSRAVTGNGSVGYSTEFTVNGSGNVSNVYLMDGVELESGATSSTTPGGVNGRNMGVDAVQEFKVLTGSYSAQYGKRMGGIINIATRSGANRFHGTGFEFLRNADMDARNFFDQTHSPAPFKRNDFGGALGGPIKKDQTFFFFNYEGLRDRSSPNLTAIAPDNNARAGFLPCGNPGVPATAGCNAATGLANVGVAANVAPYMALFPAINGPSVGQGLAESFNAPLAPANQDYWLWRLDHRISDKDSLTGRYMLTKSNSLTPAAALSTAAPRISHDQNGMLQEQKIISPTTINLLRFGFTRGYSLENSVPYSAAAKNPALAFYPGAPELGQIAFTAGATSGGGTVTITAPGTSIANFRHYVLNQYDTSDQLSKQIGAHSLIFGVQVERIQHNVDDDFYDAGAFTFPTFAAFLLGTPGSFTGINPNQPNCQVGSCNSAAKGFRQIFFSGFVQDDYKISRNLTLNLGLRYELMTTPTEVNGRIDNFVPIVLNGYPTVSATPLLGTIGLKGNHDTFAPRLGLAWDPFGNHKTAIRAGAGVFYDQIETPWLHLLQNNFPYESTLVYSNPLFPNAFAGPLSSAVPTVEFIDPNLKVPTRIQYNFSIQQQITQSASLTVGYVGAGLHHALRTADPNQAIPQILPPGSPGCTLTPCDFFAAGLPRRQPALGAVQGIVSNANGSYQALQVDYSQRVSHGLRYKASFTWSKDIDDVSGIDSALSPCGIQQSQMQTNNSADKGLSCYDVGRSFVSNFTYDLPFNKLIHGHERLMNGWQVGAIITLQDGTPFTPLLSTANARDLARNNPLRPNAVVGSVTLPNGKTFNCSSNPVNGGVTEYYVPQCFTLPPAGFYGNLGRNTVIGPGVGNLDATVEKTTKVSESLNIIFRAEAFNLGNHADFGIPGKNLFNSNGTYQAAAGTIIAPTLIPARQIQFGLKFVF